MDYISREDAIAIVKAWFGVAGIRPDNVILSIKALPSADVVERKKGKWLLVQGYNNNVLYCSCCNSEVMGKTYIRNFCPNCGAKMEG